MGAVTINKTGQIISYEGGASLLQILLDAGVFVDNPCNGKGVCGKCKVRVLSGHVGKLSDTEKEILKPDEIDTGIRLACIIKPEGDIEIELLQKERKHEVLTSGYVPEFEKEIDIRKQLVEIHSPSLEDQTPFENQLTNQLEDIEIPLDLLSTLKFEECVYTAVIYKDCYLMGLEQGDTTDKIYGVAIDIGTTTVVTSLIDMISGEELANSSMINAQKNYGLDVLTRITYEVENPEDGVEKLRKAIVDSINDMILDICKQTAINKEHIYELTVGANCTMMHMLLGVDAVSIGKSPYAPMFTNAKDLLASEIGIEVAKRARLYCLPSVSSYIGADIVAGAYVCELQKTSENILFIDIGTNGEIVFSNKGNLLCCSCAAGPALEGMNISSGMRAAQGAIEDVVITKDGIKLQVIGDEEPIGICGSGILAVVKELILTGLVTKKGTFIKMNQLEEDDYRLPMLQLNGAKREFILAENETNQLLITQGDIRQVQLAKGAILSGFYALLNKAGITMDDLDQVMIAGQFGAHLPADSLTGTGILPEGVKEKLVYVGNSSKTGAYMALMSKTVKKEMEELAKHMDYMELGATEGYERLFAKCLLFPENSVD
ncbi:putative electron transfer protein [Lachnospiraceae bacterium TWA4]|nr:putative electron transfer protein [Lachnospiraceae bacterium TWA4]